MTAAQQNRQLVERMFSDLASGKPDAFVDALADDVCWRTPGHSIWSRTHQGKRALLDDLLGPVRAQLVRRVRLTVRSVVAEDDRVVVEATGEAATKAGQAYNNEYCFVFRVEGGKIAEVTEYLDTELATRVLVPPWAAETRGVAPLS